MVKEPVQTQAQEPKKQPYGEPLLIKHEALRNITRQKYGEKPGAEKSDVEGG